MVMKNDDRWGGIKLPSKCFTQVWQSRPGFEQTYWILIQLQFMQVTHEKKL